MSSVVSNVLCSSDEQRDCADPDMEYANFIRNNGWRWTCFVWCLSVLFSLSLDNIVQMEIYYSNETGLEYNEWTSEFLYFNVYLGSQLPMAKKYLCICLFFLLCVHLNHQMFKYSFFFFAFSGNNNWRKKHECRKFSIKYIFVFLPNSDWWHGFSITSTNLFFGWIFHTKAKLKKS